MWKEKKKKFKTLDKYEGLGLGGGGGVFLGEEPHGEPCLPHSKEVSSPYRHALEVESSLFLLLEEVPISWNPGPHGTAKVPEIFLENQVPLACVQSLPR